MPSHLQFSRDAMQCGSHRFQTKWQFWLLRYLWVIFNNSRVARSNDGLNEWYFVVGGRWFSVLSLVSLNQIFVYSQLRFNPTRQELLFRIQFILQLDKTTTRKEFRNLSKMSLWAHSLIKSLCCYKQFIRLRICRPVLAQVADICNICRFQKMVAQIWRHSACQGSELQLSWKIRFIFKLILTKMWQCVLVLMMIGKIIGFN